MECLDIVASMNMSYQDVLFDSCNTVMFLMAFMLGVLTILAVMCRLWVIAVTCSTVALSCS